jgi:DNA-directed RNA polymerase specialized sigma24 family protein
MTTIEDLAQRFESDRRHLKSVAFHLLGTAADAEDAVQSAWLKASRADHGTVENLTGWFTIITAHEAVDQLRTRKQRQDKNDRHRRRCRSIEKSGSRAAAVTMEMSYEQQPHRRQAL